MSTFRSWLRTQTGRRVVPLFDADASGVVRTESRNGKRRLLRSAAMESAMIEMVESGLRDPDWLGLLYVMGWGEGDRFRPLYVGKAGKTGKKHAVSANLVNLRGDKGKFARWGDSRAYHIGGLSQALWGWDAYINPDAKYLRWAEVLFVDRDAPRLREPTSLVLIPWRNTSVGPGGERMSLEACEDAAIDVALAEFEGLCMNHKGDRWWAPLAAEPAPTRSVSPRRPVRHVTTLADLESLAQELLNEPVIGLDVETTIWEQRLCLVQVATRSFTALVDHAALGSVEALRPVFESDRVVKVIHNAPFERRVLEEHGIGLRCVFDTLDASRRLHGRTAKHSLDVVCERELGVRLDKGMQTSEWCRRPLTEAQIRYAALDAEVLVDLHAALKDVEPLLL
jgi:hypothetical protein